jgi:hypothetical protein
MLLRCLGISYSTQIVFTVNFHDSLPPSLSRSNKIETRAYVRQSIVPLHQVFSQERGGSRRLGSVSHTCIMESYAPTHG